MDKRVSQVCARHFKQDRQGRYYCDRCPIQQACDQLGATDIRSQHYAAALSSLEKAAITEVGTWETEPTTPSTA